MDDMELVVMLAVRNTDGAVVDTGDAVYDSVSDRMGVLQTILPNGMITVSTGPGRVAVAHPGTYGLSVSGLSPCGCAASLRYPSVLSVFRAAGWCGDSGHHAANTVSATVPHLDDL